MAVPGKACVVLLFVALAYCEGAGPKGVRPSAGPDPFLGKRGGKDILRPGEKIFHVMDFGAKPGGKFDNAPVFMKSWVAACKSNAPARILVPAGEFLVGPVLFAGPCVAPAPITFQISGTLNSVTDITEFENGEWLLFENVEGLKILGGGTINGMGKSVWANNDCASNSDCTQLPSSIKLHRVTNAFIQDLTSIDSMGFHIFITNCQNIRLRNLKITAPKDSPNTDGIHVSRTTRVRIARTFISTGDDCISMINGAKDVSIKDVTCAPGHGFSVGSLGKYPDEEDVANILVTNCTMTDTDNGLRIKSWPASPVVSATGLIFRDVIMNNVKNAIIIDQEYNCDDPCSKEPSNVKISDVHFMNIRGTTASPVAVNIKCSKKIPCENVQFNNIDLKTMIGPPASSTCTNAKLTFLGPQIPPPCPH